jgi:hypothetical protein
MRKLILRTLSLLPVVFLNAACGDVVAVHVFPFPLCVPIALGDSAYVFASADRSNFPVVAYSSVTRPEAFSWSSSNFDVISVSSRGLIHAKSLGVATISASAEGLTGSSEIRVTAVHQTASVEPVAVTLGVGDTVLFTTHAWDSAGTALTLAGGQVLFSSGDDASIVYVWDEWPDRGRVVGVSPGTANITWGVGRRCGVIPVAVK